MRVYRELSISACVISVAVACQRAPEPGPVNAGSAPIAPLATPVPAPGAETAPAANASSASELASGGGYPMCGGQHIANAAQAPRSGATQVQLAPAFLDEMAACKVEDGLPREGLPAGEGHINAKGDCEFADVGVSCHYHSGSEFVTSSTSEQTAGQGELHCIVPGEEPKSPHVYGAHVMCSHHEQGEVHGTLTSHETHEGASCSFKVLEQLQPCHSFRCCDDGSLTNPVADLIRDGRNDVRPDFRICSDTLEIDCDLLANFTPHDANSPALGGVKQPVFAVAPRHAPTKIAQKHAAH
jgi:hypothetical protein